MGLLSVVKRSGRRTAVETYGATSRMLLADMGRTIGRLTAENTTLVQQLVAATDRVRQLQEALRTIRAVLGEQETALAVFSEEQWQRLVETLEVVQDGTEESEEGRDGA